MKTDKAVEAAQEIYSAKVAGQLAEMISPDHQESRPLWEIDSIFLNPDAQLPQVKTWGKMGDRPCFPKQGLITIDAKPKQGKSFCAYAAMIPLISGKQFGSITPNERANLIIVFDTEMSAISLQPRYRAFRTTAGDNCNNFLIVPLANTPKSERWKVIEGVTLKYNPGVVIIDHISKLVANYNDPAEASAVSEHLSMLKAARTVFVIIHQNKSKDDTNMRGAVGSALNDDQCEAYTAAKKNGVFSLTLKEARDTDSENAAPFMFAVAANEEKEVTSFIDASAILKESEQRQKEEWRKNFKALFGDDDLLRNYELVERIKSREGLEEGAAKKKIAKAKDMGAIRKTSTDRNAPYELAPEGA